MTNKIKSDYALWNEYLNTPREVFIKKHGASFSTKDLEKVRRKSYEEIEKCTKMGTPYGYETKLELDGYETDWKN